MRERHDDTTTRRMGRRALAMAIVAVLLPPTLAAVGRDVATAARPTPGAPPSLAGAYVGGLHRGGGGATQTWPVFEPSQLGGVVSGTYGTVTTDRRRPGWLGQGSQAALRVRGTLVGARLTFEVLYREGPVYRFAGEVRAHTIVGTLRPVINGSVAAYPLTFYDCQTAPRAITPCAIAHTR